MITFYYAPQSSATRVHVALEELGVPYEKARVHLDKGEQRKPEFLAVNPNGKVPALVDGDVKVFESAAILLYLGARYGVEKGLWPKLGTAEHGDAMSWTVWANTELAPAVLDYVLNTADLPWAFPKEHKSAFIAGEAKKRWMDKVGMLDRWLEGREWMLGNKFSLVDVAVGMVTGMGPMFGGLPLDAKNVGAWVGRVTSRPAFVKVASEK